MEETVTARRLTAPSHIRAGAPRPDYAARREWVLEQVEAGRTTHEIARALRITRVSADQAITQAIIKGRSITTERPCMTCGNTFASEGIHNRMCDGCKQRGYQAWGV